MGNCTRICKLFVWLQAMIPGATGEAIQALPGRGNPMIRRNFRARAGFKRV